MLLRKEKIAIRYGGCLENSSENRCLHWHANFILLEFIPYKNESATEILTFFSNSLHNFG